MPPLPFSYDAVCFALYLCLMVAAFELVWLPKRGNVLASVMAIYTFLYAAVSSVLIAIRNLLS